MLNYTNKWINSVVICVSFVLTIILFIILDTLFINRGNIELYNENILTSKYIEIEKGSSNKISRKSIEAIDLKDVMLNTMQIADIYEETNSNIDGNSDTNNAENNKLKNNKWRIEIPKISLVAPIKQGTSQDILATAVGHFEESNKYSGNIALAGHNRGYNCNFFENIKRLENGDKIIYYTEKGKKEYRVTLNKIIHQTDWSYIEAEGNKITLITCVENMYEYRRCVQAVEVI